MSYIDCFDHEHVGFFAARPIYRPLVEYTPNDTLDGQFSCHEKMLILGGGYLEHPGMVISNLDFVAAYFISEWLDYCEDNKCSPFSDEETDQWAEKAHDILYGKDQFKMMECVHWSMRDYSDFYNDCQSNALNCPFIETQQRNAFEPWLAKNFGELVVFSYPDLIVDPQLSFIASKVDRYLYGNISILPLGYPNDSYGRKTKSGKVIQGFRAFSVSRNV